MTTAPVNTVEALDHITQLEGTVRDFINTGRHKTTLLKSSSTWNQICSSLDVIGDTVLCIRDYLSSPYPVNDGLKYVYTYGILQALFIQQDAVRHLSEAFGVSHAPSATLKRIRDIRNAAIGHPTKHQSEKSARYNYISRFSLSRTGFTLMRSYPEHEVHFEDVDIVTIFDEQLADIDQALTALADNLREADRLHRERFGGKLISDVFHASTGYLFEKVSQGVHSSAHGNRSFGLSMLGLIQKMYSDFEGALKERGELNEYIQYDLDQYRHAISVLTKYLSEEGGELGEIDARIYLFYLSEQHNHFLKVAAEIDDEYCGKDA